MCVHARAAPHCARSGDPDNLPHRPPPRAPTPNPKGYARGAPQEMSLFDTFRYGLYIDFESLTVDFGRQLRRHIHDHDGSPAPGARASGGAIEHDGSVAHRPRASAPPPAVSA